MLSTYFILATANSLLTPPPTPVEAVQEQVIKQEPVLKVGDLAPEFFVEKWGKSATLKLSDRRDKLVVLTFWNTVTPNSILVLDHIQAINRKMKADQPVVLMYVNTLDNKYDYSHWMDKNSGKFAGHWGFDPGAKDATIAARWYGVKTVPTTFVIGKTGRVFAIIDGWQTNDKRLDDALRRAEIKID